MTSSIWTENKNPSTKDTIQPRKLILPEVALQKINNLSLNLNQFFGYITAAKFDTEAGLDGFTDSSKLMPGVGDYYKVLSKMGDPIKKFSDVTIQEKATNPNFKLENRMKIWQRASECTALVTALRRMDQDKYRIPYIRDNRRQHASCSTAAVRGWESERDSERFVEAQGKSVLKTRLRRRYWAS